MAGNAKDHTAQKHVDAGQGEPRADRGTLAENPVASVTEGKEHPHAEQTTMMTQSSNENSRKRSTEKKPGESIADELTKAEIQLLKHTQFVYFQE